MEGKRIERRNLNEDPVRVMEDYAHVKNAAYLASKKVIEEVSAQYSLEEKHRITLDECVQEKIIASTATTTPELRAVAIEEVERLIGAYDLDRRIAKTFSEKFDLAMKVY